MKTAIKIFSLSGIHPLVRNNYYGRIVNSGMGIPVGIPLLLQVNAGLPFMIAGAAISLLWPHIALLMVCSAEKQKEFEQYININLDAVIFGFWIPIFHFNPLAIIILIANLGSGGILNGGLKFMIFRIGSLASAASLNTLIFGFRFDPATSLPTTIACGFSIICFTFASAFISYNTQKSLGVAKQKLKIQKTQLEMLSTKLSKYLSPQIYNSIFTGRKDVKIETSRKKLTVFFSDIQNFTMTTDEMEAEALSSLLNNYLDEMTNIAIRFGGTIDKYIGDAIMIFFGDPETKGDREDAVSCVSMAIEMRDRMSELRKKWLEMGIVNPLNIRIGINTGFCTVGNFGSEQRLDYTVIGSQVNLASRLESNAHPGQILISADTYLLIKNKIYCRRTGEINVKGIARPVMTYQVIDYYDRISEKDYHLSENRKGISIEIDFSKAEPVDITEILKRISERFDN